MSKKPTSADAQLVLQLYDLRREAEMRKARNWWAAEFFPPSADDVMKVAFIASAPENNWFRQVAGYWNMAASFVLLGALNEQLFLQPSVSGEMFLIFAKVHPFLKEIRQKLNNPDAWLNVEKVATSSKLARKRLERVSVNVESRRKQMAKSSKK